MDRPTRIAVIAATMLGGLAGLCTGAHLAAHGVAIPAAVAAGLGAFAVIAAAGRLLVTRNAT